MTNIVIEVPRGWPLPVDSRRTYVYLDVINDNVLDMDNGHMYINLTNMNIKEYYNVHK